MIAGEIVVVVYGRPAPKGSLRCVGRDGKHQLVEDNRRTKPWRAAVVDTAKQSTGRADKHEPVGVEVTSSVRRPAGHYTAAHGLKSTAPDWPTSARTGDVDKLARLVLDALQDAGMLNNDAQVVEVTSRKTWTRSGTVDALDEPGAIVRVYPIGAEP